MTDDILEALGAQRTDAAKSRHRHSYQQWTPEGIACRCGAVKDPAATRKGRNNRKRGNTFEVTVARKLKRVLVTYRKGQYGGKTDVDSPLAVIQCKKVASLFPTRINALLREVEAEATADQYPMVALSNVPGAGGTTQELIVMDLNDFANLLDIIADGHHDEPFEPDERHAERRFTQTIKPDPVKALARTPPPEEPKP